MTNFIDFLFGLLCVLILLPFLAVAAAAAVVHRAVTDNREKLK